MGGLTHELTGQHWDRIVDINLMGVVNGLLAAYPEDGRRGARADRQHRLGGRAGGTAFVTPYATTKPRWWGLSTGLRPEAAPPRRPGRVLCAPARSTRRSSTARRRRGSRPPRRLPSPGGPTWHCSGRSRRRRSCSPARRCARWRPDKALIVVPRPGQGAPVPAAASRRCWSRRRSTRSPPRSQRDLIRPADAEG